VDRWWATGAVRQWAEAQQDDGGAASATGDRRMGPEGADFRRRTMRRWMVVSQILNQSRCDETRGA
jgi:hypothetical protein